MIIELKEISKDKAIVNVKSENDYKFNNKDVGDIVLRSIIKLKDNIKIDTKSDFFKKIIDENDNMFIDTEDHNFYECNLIFDNMNNENNIEITLERYIVK